MEIFKSLAKMKNAKVKSEDISKHIYLGMLRIGGRVKITKGCITGELGYWVDVEEMGYDGCISASDWNYEDGLENVTISGLEVDCLDQFIKGLTDHGMKSTADSIGISEKEYEAEMFKDIARHPAVKILFKDKKLWQALSKEEQQGVAITNFIEKYDALGTTHQLRNVGIISSDYKGKPTIEQLLQFKKDRIVIVNEPIEE